MLGFALAGWLFHNFPFASTFPPNITRLGHFDIQAAVIGAVLFGFIPCVPIGLAQWVILRRRLPISSWWIVSIPLGVSLLHFLSDGFPNAGDLSVAVIASGALIGIFQWNLMRAQVVSSEWWIAASLAGWYLGWIIGIALLDIGGLIGLHYSQKHAILGISIGLVYSLLTGIGLVYLVQKRHPLPMKEPPNSIKE